MQPHKGYALKEIEVSYIDIGGRTIIKDES